jgi:lipopolysaccharide transport system ATP-binding protein
VERFLDTPVKRFSSGMYVRLAFAVAAHLEPDILLVDEVLAVGDATYQKRCIDRMSELAASGRTILFVSHNMDLIPRLCRTGVLLERGRVTRVGPAAQVVDQYLADHFTDAESEDVRQRPRTGDNRARFTRLQLLDPAGQPRSVHVSGEDLTLRMELEVAAPLQNAALAVVLRTVTGTRLISSWTRETGYPVDLEPGTHTFDCRFRNVTIRPGQRVAVMLWMEAGGVVDAVDDARTIEVVDSPETRHYSSDPCQGIVLCDYAWQKVSPPAEVVLV